MQNEYFEKNGVRLLKVAPPIFSPYADVFFSTRIGGVSTGDFASLNLSTRHDDAPENVRANFLLVCRAAGLDEDRLVFAEQTHSADAVAVTHADVHRGLFVGGAVPHADALVTDEPGLILCVRTADCVPVFLLDPEKKVCAAVHSGWRGTVGGITKNTVLLMKERFGCDPGIIRAAVGPHICRECFEVDEPVAARFTETEKRIVPEKRGIKYHVDLGAYVRLQLTDCGVPPENVADTGLCTACDTKQYFSHRAEHGHTGGMCGFIRVV